MALSSAGKKRIILKLARIYGWFCTYCGVQLVDGTIITNAFMWLPEYGIPKPQIPSGAKMATLDHKIPQSKGGSDDMDNLVLCCPECNWKKSNRVSYEDFQVEAINERARR